MRLTVITAALICFLFSNAVYGVDSCRALFAKHASHFKIAYFNDGARAQVTLATGESFWMTLAKSGAANPDQWRMNEGRTRAQGARLAYVGGVPVNESRAKLESDPDVNCHGYACSISDLPELPSGWLDGLALRKILRLLFVRTTALDDSHLAPKNIFEPTHVVAESDIREFFSLSKVENGDLVVFQSGPATIHSAVIEKRWVNGQQQVWARSKFDDLQTWVLRLDLLSRFYPSDRIEIWRRK